MKKTRTKNPKASVKHREVKKIPKAKKTKQFWTTGTDKQPCYIIKDGLLRNWLIEEGYRRTKDYYVYRIVKGGIKQQYRKDAFAHTIKFVEKESSSMKSHLGNELMTCALEQCEDILIKRVGLLLSLPKINIKHKRGKKN